MSRLGFKLRIEGEINNSTLTKRCLEVRVGTIGVFVDAYGFRNVCMDRGI